MRAAESGRSFFLQDAQLNAASPILRLTRSGETAWGPLPGGDWTIFQANHSTYEPLAWAHRDSLDYPANKSPLATVIQVSRVSPTFARDIPVTYAFSDKSYDCGINAPTPGASARTPRRRESFKSFSPSRTGSRRYTDALAFARTVIRSLAGLTEISCVSDNLYKEKILILSVSRARDKY